MKALVPDWDDVFGEGADFDRLVERVWEWQWGHNAVIRRFCDLVGSPWPTFVPIRFFKDFDLKCGEGWEPELVFRSSGTGAMERSRHLVRYGALYDRALMDGYRHFFGEGDRTVFALLPNYLEKGDSSLVYMVTQWMKVFGNPGSGFYLYDFEVLRRGLVEAMERGEKILLIGVSYALLDFAEGYPMVLPPDAVVMETGGMKGRKEELVRAELHARLKAGLGVNKVYSEYGMTELLSQAYTDGGDRFRCPPWMRVVVTDLYVPGLVLPLGQAGRINVVDLANLYSCAFIRTDDVGRGYADGSFEVLGRVDFGELRGCGLMYGG